MKTPALVFDDDNLRYFTGVSNATGCLVMLEKEKYWLTSDVENASSGKIKNVIRAQPLFPELMKLLDCLKIKKAHVPFANMTYSQFLKLSKMIKIEDNSEEITALRQIKSKDEIRRIRKACRYADEAMKEAHDAIKVGVTEKKVRAEAMNAVLGACEDQSFTMMVAAGKNSMYSHSLPSDKKIREGELIIVDLGFKHEGYCSDLTRTFAISPSEKQALLFDIVLESQETAISALEKGVKLSEVALLVKDLFADQDLDMYWKYGLGHGVGLQIHESPSLSASSTDTLENNMVFTIEPGLHVPGVGGCRIEDTILFNKRAEKLTRFPKVLQI